MKIIERTPSPTAVQRLVQSGLPPLLARLYAARGVVAAEELDTALSRLLPPSDMKDAALCAALLADAIAAQQRICIVADYDCDGATACATAIRGLHMLGARDLLYEVPDRARDGYGLTPAIAERVHARGAQVLLTVDNGIASVEGVERARQLGLTVLITDHHLPGSQHPGAHAVVNPNQHGCGFASKAIAGVGVMFYVLLALRSELRARGAFDTSNQPRLDALLPLVALGTVADVVALDANNRRLVAQGLQRIRRGHMPAGMRALFQVSNRNPAQAATADFGFGLGPRINAAGRLADMTIGIECLLTDDDGHALQLAQALERINRERQSLEGGMREHAFALADALCSRNSGAPPAAISLYDAQFHEGVVGIVASRIKDRLHRPSFVFADSQTAGEVKGSGRSIPGLHLRDALDLIAKRHPGLLRRFGGHAMAAGCTIARDDVAAFGQALARIAQEWLDERTLTRCIETDGPLPPELRCTRVADELNQHIWGQGFAPPVFSEPMQILSQRLVGEGHLKLQLRHCGEVVDGIWFGRTQPLPDADPVHLAFRLDINEWRGQRKVQFLVEGAAA